MPVRARVANALLTVFGPLVVLLLTLLAARVVFVDVGAAVLLFFSGVIGVMIIGLVFIPRLTAVDGEGRSG